MPRFRTGHCVPLNVYDGDEPVFQAHDAASAMKLVGLLNMGWHLTQITYDQLQDVFAESERYWGEEDFLDRLRADVWMLLMPKNVVVSAPDRPVERPESPTEPTPATGQPESREGHTGLVVEMDPNGEPNPGLGGHVHTAFCRCLPEPPP